MTAPMPPALDYLIGHLEATAEQCKGGDGSNNALRKNGRGEGLRIAESMIEKAWPAIAAQMDLPSAMEAERLRAALRRAYKMLARDSNGACSVMVPYGDKATIPCGDAPTAPHDPACPFAALSRPAQPSALWAGLQALLSDFDESERLCRSRADELREFDYADRADVYESVARRLRELLGLPPKDGRS